MLNTTKLRAQSLISLNKKLFQNNVNSMTVVQKTAENKREKLSGQLLHGNILHF